MAIDFPNSPTSGDLYTAGGKTWQWNGTFWSAYGTSPVYRVSDTPPIGPSTGDTWYESDTGRLYIYTDSYWVEIGSAGRVTVSANDLTGPTLASNVVSSSLTSVGTITNLQATAATINGWTVSQPGLVLITSGITTNAGNSVSNGVVTVGSAVSTIDVYGAFSSTYDNYHVVYSGGAGSSTHTLLLQFGIGATITNINYFGGAGFINVGAGTWQVLTDNGTSSANYAGGGGTNVTTMSLDVLMPNLAENTYFYGQFQQDPNGRFGQCSYAQLGSTQFTSFRITPSTGTLTGGTVRVYGYRNS